MMNQEQLSAEALVRLICQRADSGLPTTPTDLATITGRSLEQVFKAVTRLVEQDRLMPTEYLATPLPEEVLKATPARWVSYDDVSGRDGADDLAEKEAAAARANARLEELDPPRPTSAGEPFPVVNGSEL